MDDSFLEWPVRYTPVMTPFSKGEQRQAPVFPLSIPNAPFDAFGPIPPGRLYPHGDAVISLGAMPIVPIPRVPMPPMPTLALTPVLLPKQGLPVRPTTLPRPLMISRHMSIPIVLQRPRHPTDYSARRPSLPSPQPRPSDDPILPPPIIHPLKDISPS
ncbi:hypothetical protein BS47DRAFT_1145020 [Hydnum rufescens UP504]|uniref:Uncharacterized protein n=1 Tax=Hydnum rufescens UP504 TaxID=1448309 RepID=A0A9P6DUI6_9AGAM|nr:hypothetical protein BS47DRAFT_1145020 [Hydnum rufescens UP504]